MKHFVRCILFGVALGSVMHPSQAQTRVAGTAETRGNSHAQGTRNSGTSLASWSTRADAQFHNTLSGSLLGRSAPLADVNLQGYSNRTCSRARVSVRGVTVYDRDTSRGGSFSLPPYMLDVFTIPPVEVFNFGIFGVRAAGNAGAGAQFSGTYNLVPSPPRVDLSAAAQTWANASAYISATLLWGVGELRLSAQVNFFNTTLHLDGHASRDGLALSRASLDVILWELYIKFRLMCCFGLELASQTLVHEQGPSRSVQLF